ncbi:hypothetical protein BDZ90DRAFT_261773 [Jaminaea rosea]|uniref:Late embryogenesis abundant protein LEA-2 subgroup domain-containing protein n=1 Tax=Jaminaea rosea TaxID=1569628 RepID=A0A316US87_9BASI|nr:hypothetical protein BDZ90DRAFT_261773 [Jaminaea rosea]PWN25995.1 hypothetical protein BDZ90DRAFT_261773 [Jaminaea rosea]
MSYPFSGNRQSQSDYRSHDYSTRQPPHQGGQYYDDDYYNAAQSSGAYPMSGGEQYRDNYYPSNHQHQHSMSGNDAADDTLRDHGAQGYSEKAAVAATPGGGTTPGSTDAYANYGSRGNANRNSIFSQQDRHVFFKRSVPVRALRSIFCIVLWTIIIIITVILLVVLFARPPNIALLSVDPPTAQDFDVSGTSFTANGSVNFAVSNPNSFSATITHLNAQLFDANLPNDVQIGNGTLKDQKIKANDNTTIVFPFTLGINLQNGAEALIQDVVSSCGLDPSSSSKASGNLNVRLAIDAHISVLSIGVSVPVNRNISVECPTNQLADVIKSITGAVGDIGSAVQSILGGGSKRSFATPLPLDGSSMLERDGAGQDDLPAQLDLLSRREVLGKIVEAWLPRSAAGSKPLAIRAPGDIEL